MSRRSPTLEGFKLMFRRSSFGFAEIAWRWSFGAAVTVLLGFSFVEYLDTLPVSGADRFLLNTHHPYFISRALAHILSGSGERVALAAAVLGTSLALLWILVSSGGRAITLRALLTYLWTKQPEREFPFRLSSLWGLSFLRAIAGLALSIGGVGAMVLAGMVTSPEHPAPGSAFLVFLTVGVIVFLAFAVVNWFLSMAGLFVVARNCDTFSAMNYATGFLREHLGGVLASSFWFGLAHLVAFSVATSAVGFPLGFASILPRGAVLLGVLVVTLLYFAVADFLYIGRMGAYLWILDGSELDPAPEAPSEPPAGHGIHEPPPIEIMDPNELILSDVPIS